MLLLVLLRRNIDCMNLRDSCQKISSMLWKPLQSLIAETNFETKSDCFHLKNRNDEETRLYQRQLYYIGLSFYTRGKKNHIPGLLLKLFPVKNVSEEAGFWLK